MAHEVNPYRLQYIPAPDNSEMQYKMFTEPLRMRQQGRENDFRMRSEQRQETRDTNADERDRVSQEQRARQMLMENQRSGQREDLYAKQEERRNRAATLDQSRLTDAEHEKLIHALFYAQTPEEQHYAAQELMRHGYHVEPLEGASAPTAPAPPSPAPIAPPKAPMSPQDAATSSALDQAEADIMPKLTGHGGKGSPAGDAALSGQLDQIDQKYSAGLGVPPGGLPGSAMGRRPSPGVARSNAMLSPDDPYNRLAQ